MRAKNRQAVGIYVDGMRRKVVSKVVLNEGKSIQSARVSIMYGVIARPVSGMRCDAVPSWSSW